jgi:leucyl aminopeptidase
MKVSVTTIDLSELDVDLLLIPVRQEMTSEERDLLRKALGGAYAKAEMDLDGTFSKSAVVYPEGQRAKRVAVIGMGKTEDLDAERLRRVAGSGAEIAGRFNAETVALHVPETDVEPETASQALVEGFLMAGYRFDRYRTNSDDKGSEVQRLVLHSTSQDRASRRGADRGRVIAESVATARDLVNMSPDEKTATLLSRFIEKSAKKHGYSASVWDKSLIEEEKMGGILAVNRGSTEPPTFTILEWYPENAANSRPVVLVGKGVVFDTGGLSLKPTKDSMDHMKADMAGAAAVVGAMEAIARLELPINVVAFIPATDNRPGENAYVPGEVVRMHSGATVEVLNTDAEGRMLLADALSYAKTYKPSLVIDIATLTGAQVVALGSEVAAVMTNDDADASKRLDAMEAAGHRSGELVHRLPLFQFYKDLLKSDVADLKNIGGSEAGTITAGKFLEHFTDYPWVHIDIAGPAFISSAKPYRPKGGTGFGVRLIVDYLREQANPRRGKQG